MKNEVKCTRCCVYEGRYAISELMTSGAKVWRTDLCDMCEKAIAKRNAEIRGLLPGRRFVEK